ncbi:RNase adapter RapZ [Acidiphilium acidophilum]|uniref:RNase adapter RapZ n=1 Tax=Acidiphilium acidophilum TaxID=76588 RepID=UPI002E8E6C54|nr:RNase adapter RapZ [Acidiphilium acidophilum]
MMPPPPARTVPRLIVVSGLSGAGKNSVLRTLEDIGYEAVDNPPLSMVETLIGAERNLAVGIDARTRDFSAEQIIETLARLRRTGTIQPELIFTIASTEVLQRRFTETRRRHPLAPQGTVAEGIATEQDLTSRLRDSADWVIDTSDLPLATLRRMIEARFASDGPGLAITLISFAFPAGLPREADLVFDARFLRNPHYIPDLRPQTGLDEPVRAYIRSDPDYAEFCDRLGGLVAFMLPRFVREGKKYATIAIGCTGGRHRSVTLIEHLARLLQSQNWTVRIEHRELDGIASERQTIQQPPQPDGRPAAQPENPGGIRRILMSGASK